MATAGGSLGFALAIGLLKVIAVQMAQFQPASAGRIAADTTLLPIAFGFSVAAWVLVGTLPAVRLSRRDITLSLKGGTTPAGAKFVGYHARDLVVFVELGLAVVLLVVAGMWLTFFAEIRRVTPQFPADEVVAVRVPSHEVGAVVQRVAALPGVAGVAMASNLPGRRSSGAVARVQAVAGRTARASVVEAGPSFFQTLGLPILRGRSFDASEMNVNADVVIISEGLCRLALADRRPTGRSADDYQADGRYQRDRHRRLPRWPQPRIATAFGPCASSGPSTMGLPILPRPCAGGGPCGFSWAGAAAAATRNRIVVLNTWALFFISRRDAKAIITPDELGVAEG